MKRYKRIEQSICSFDFINDGNYSAREINGVIERACEECGVDFVASDYRSVDYSDYPEYAGEVVSQCGFDFNWESRYGYSAKDMREALEEGLSDLGYELIGIDFEGR